MLRRRKFFFLLDDFAGGDDFVILVGLEAELGLDSFNRGGDGVGSRGDLVFFGIGDEVEIWVGEKFFHFGEEFAGSGVGAEGGKVTVGEAQREVMLFHLEEMADLVLEVVFVTEIHVGNVDVEEVLDVAVLFGEAGEFGDGKDKAIDVWVMHEADLFHIGEGAFDGRSEEVSS